MKIKAWIDSYLIESVYDARANKEKPESGHSGKSCQTVNETQDIKDHVEAVRRPEELVRLLADDGMSEHEDDYHHHKQQHAREPWRQKQMGHSATQETLNICTKFSLNLTRYLHGDNFIG